MTVSLAGGVRHPKIYAYTIDQYVSTPWKGKRNGAGLVKVGDTQRDVLVRIREQLAAIKMPVETAPDILLVMAAVTDDGRVFRDYEVHAALKKASYHNIAGEWFECTKDEVAAAIQAVREGKGLPSARPVSDFKPRPEQAHAVEETAAYLRAHSKSKTGQAPDYLWNAKMRFGKTFTTYQLAREMGWTRILVLTYKPAVEPAWREDLSHKDFAGWRFHGKEDDAADISDKSPLVWFASFQDVLGTDDDGKAKDKNRDLYKIEWDAVVVDEYHFGAWRDAARSIYVGEVDEVTGEKTEGDKSEAKIADTPDLDDGFVEGIEAALAKQKLKVDNFLYLSGTPFRALTEGEFLEDQVYNWTYSDEQRAKKNWKGAANPYVALPQMHLLAYEMPEKLKEVALNNLSEFSLTEFFRTAKDDHDEPAFIHEDEVQRWLDLLRGQDLSDLWAAVSTTNRPPMPFADSNLLTALQHTVWYLPGVDACLAMQELLGRSHNNFFRDYTIVVAAGNAAGMGQEALGPVEDAITNVPQDAKSITLSCGKLMTGVTVPAWAGIFMLRELKSPETYFQAAFRVQSPWAYKQVNTAVGGEDEIVVKEQCYVLDFSPNRALRLIVEYATKLQPTTAADMDEEAALDEFMEFLPVLAFDGSTMRTVSAGDVIDYLTTGISSSMLARRWNSPELITLDLKAMEAILADDELVQSLERIEMFRNISDDLSALISSNKELKPKKLAREELTPAEKKEDDEAKKKRNGIKEKLRRFLTRIPAFMYLTDDREKTVYDIITQDETEMFEKVTTLSLKDFERLVNAGAFNASKMNDAVWKFRQFEDPSLSYTKPPEVQTRGGWNVRRYERFAELIEKAALTPGDHLSNSDAIIPVTATVTEDYGLLVDGVRHESPDLAAVAATGAEGIDGWSYWTLVRDGAPIATLEDLRASKL
jgi:hypothetical protein